ncbi:MAG: type II toxin-antitoxin system ParD family antitoxin [Xanthobacteraceae bacterium]
MTIMEDIRMPSSYALGDHFERLVARLIKSGRYNSKSEVIRDGLRLLQDREESRAARLDELRKLFRAGVQSGPRRPAEEVFDRLEIKYRKMAEQRER